VISLDTNVIFSALNPRDSNHREAQALLNRHSLQAFCICPIVHAELRASAVWPALRAWLKLQGVTVIWELPEVVWDNAGISYGKYAIQRRSGVLPRRLVADFLIAAHAAHHGLEVLTFDDTVLKAVFQEVTLLPLE
jgi:predicted nucleic acid-binding protein